jgi:hypothetical protein
MFDLEHPVNRDRQPPYNDDKIKDKVKNKLDKVIMKGSLELTDIKFVEAMMFMFDVPKGDDIRMVYNCSKLGLNKALWAPWFSLPMINTISRWVIAGSWLADNDYGDMFLNFPLHAKLHKHCGIDLTQLYPNMKASDISQYVDDMRIIAPTKDIAWQCSSRTAKTLCYLGLQDAARKRRPQSQCPGAWSGATIASDGEVVMKGVTQEQWKKLQ